MYLCPSTVFGFFQQKPAVSIMSRIDGAAMLLPMNSMGTTVSKQRLEFQDA